jgi:hypothetical protein
LQRFVAKLCHEARRRPAAAFASTLAILLLGVYFDPLFVSRTFADRDMLPFFFPIEKAVHDSWRHGHIPLVLPEISFGRLLAANPNTGAFYPLRIAMALLPFPFSFKFFPIVHLWLAGFGLYLLARARNASPVGAAVGGIVLAFSGAATSDILYPAILPGLALIPWFLLAVERLGRSPTARRVAAAGGVWTLLLLAGDVITSGLALLGGVLLLVEMGGPGLRRRAALGGAAIAAGTLAASVQLVPAILFAPWTGRALGRYALWRALSWSVHPWRLFELFVPFPFGDVTAIDSVWGQRIWSGKGSGFFLSLYSGAFAAAALVIARPRKRLFLYGAGGFALAASMAGAFVDPDYSLHHSSSIPLRYPEKLLVLFVVVTALLAAEAADRLGSGRGAVFSLAVAAVLAACAGIAWRAPLAFSRFVESNWSSAGSGPLAARSMPGILGGAAGRWAILGLILLAYRDRFPWRGILCVLLFADVATSAAKCVPGASEQLVRAPPPAIRAVLRENRSDVFAFFPIWEKVWPTGGAPLRVGIDEIENFLWGDIGAAWGVFHAFNMDYDRSDFYRVQLAAREVELRGAADGSLRRFLGAFGARTSLTNVPRAWFGFSGPARRVAPAFLLTNPDALPRIRLARRFREVRDIREAYSLIHARKVDLLETTVLETGRSGEGQASAGRLRIERLGREGLRVKTEASGAAVLLLPLSPQPFREVLVDGENVQPFPANLCWTAVPIPEGKHLVSLHEKLPGGISGLLLSFMGLVLLAAMVHPHWS